MTYQNLQRRPTKVAIAVAGVLALGSASTFASSSIVEGTVGGVFYTPPVFADTAAASSPASTEPSVYEGAKVCFDLNNNGKCDAGEPYTMSSASGSFKLSSSTLAPLIAEISTSATNNGNAITSRNVFRVTAAQVQAATVNPLLPAKVNLTPIATEVALAIENNGQTYSQAVATIAQRIGVSTSDLLTPPSLVTSATDLPAILKESVIAQNRLTLAAKFVDRGNTVGQLRGNFDCPMPGSTTPNSNFDSTNANACTGTDLNTVNIPQAQEYAYNLEGMPQYDYVFVVIEENESQTSVVGNTKLPYIQSFLASGNVFYNYFSTGAPSEPNYLALGSADDWGQTGDEAIPYPAITGVRANIQSAMDAAGLSWHEYEGSLWPSAAGTTANLAGSAAWNTATGGAYFDNPTEAKTLIPASTLSNDGVQYTSSLVAKKHNTAVWFADVVAQPDYLANSRSISGAYGSLDVNGNPIPYINTSNTNATAGDNYTSAGDWDNSLQAYATANGITSWWTGNTQPWVQDQFLADLKAGTIANLNIIVPDQDDDMHNLSTVPRTDYWFQNVVTKIKSSAIWNDPTKRVAIVFTFDEGESATTSCCGWNPERTGDGKAQLVTFNAAGQETASVAAQSPFTEAYKGSAGTSTLTFTPPAYSNGNHGHGVTTFALQTNQAGAPSGLYDTDYYSHFSFLRTLQDIFGLADPGAPGTYMNRSKYTEQFIYANATVLPEFAGSANPHFDAVRAMNHVYQFPATVTHVTSAGATQPVTVGPDPTQTNLWAQ